MSSHSVFLINNNVAKLGNLEFMKEQHNGDNKEEDDGEQRRSSPWQCPHCSSPGVHCDIYSLGCVIHELCTGP